MFKLTFCQVAVVDNDRGVCVLRVTNERAGVSALSSKCLLKYYIEALVARLALLAQVLAVRRNGGEPWGHLLATEELILADGGPSLGNHAF